MTDRIETARLLLRRPHPRDEAPFVAFYGSERAAIVGGPMDARGAWFRFLALFGHWDVRGFGRFVIEDRETGASLGHAGPFRPLDWPEGELTWTLWVAEAEGRGIAREAATAVRDHAYAVLGWETAVSYIHPDNARSIALAERLGCRPDPHAVLPPGLEVRAYRHPAPERLQ